MRHTHDDVTVSEAFDGQVTKVRRRSDAETTRLRLLIGELDNRKAFTYRIGERKFLMHDDRGHLREFVFPVETRVIQATSAREACAIEGARIYGPRRG